MATPPAHYTRGNIEVWDFIRDQDLSYFLGNAIKYICRAGHKGIDGRSIQDAYIQDLKKAIHYLENELLHTRELDGPGGTVSRRVWAPDWQDET